MTILNGVEVFGKTAYNSSSGKGIYLKQKIKVIGILKKSSSSFWKTLKPGDEFELRFKMVIGNSHSAVIEVHSEGQEVLKGKSTHISKNMSNLEFELVD